MKRSRTPRTLRIGMTATESPGNVKLTTPTPTAPKVHVTYTPETSVSTASIQPETTTPTPADSDAVVTEDMAAAISTAMVKPTPTRDTLIHPATCKPVTPEDHTTIPIPVESHVVHDHYDIADDTRREIEEMQRELDKLTAPPSIVRSNMLPTAIPTIIRKFTKSDSEIPALFDFQISPVDYFIPFIKKKMSILFAAPTGAGKMYMGAALMRQLIHRYPEQFGNEDHPILFVTAPSICIQSRRVINDFGLTHYVHCLSYANLRSYVGTLFCEPITEIVDGEPDITWHWNKDTLPSLLLLDEVQNVKNEASSQARICRGFARTGNPVFMMSASPCSRPNHTRVIATAIQPMVTLRTGARMRMEDSWFPSYIRQVSSPKHPDDFSPAAMERVLTSYGEQFYRLKGIRFKKQCRIRQLMIDFQTEEEQAEYDIAFQEYQTARAMAGKHELTGLAELFVAILKFRMAGESIRAPRLAVLLVEYMQKGFNVILGTGFQETLRIVYQLLTTEYGIPKEKISIIIGGQSTKERQLNVDRFQRDEAHIMLLMFQAGGAGLSLHHDGVINSRPRRVFLPPVWNGEEQQQVLGRAHRITSVSVTYQYIVWYSDTIETRVAQRCAYKIKAGKAVIGQDNWSAAYDERVSADDEVPEEKVRVLRPTDSNDNSDSDNDTAEAYELPIDSSDDSNDKEEG